MKNLLHELHMRWKIRRILAYNKKHPEECFSLENYLDNCATAKPQENNITAESILACMAELKSHSQQGVHESLRPLPLSVESLERLYPVTPFNYYRYLFGDCGIRPYMPTYANAVKVEAFDSEEERQKAYEWLEQVSGGDSND